MVQDFCPKCGAKTSPTDTHCLDCGADLQAERRKLRQQLQEGSLSARSGQSDEPKVAMRNAASAGRAAPGESSKETRLRVFDKQAAEGLRVHALVCLCAGLASALAGILLLATGLPRMTALGFGEVFGRALSNLHAFATLSDASVVAIVLTGTGLGGLLTGVGLLLRAAAAHKAVKDVQAGEKPEIVGMSPALQIGLYCLAVFCPPVGLILGLVLRTTKDTDVAAFGGQMIWLSLAVMVVLVGEILITKLVASLASNNPPAILTGSPST
jgi:hypothetical protein